MSREDFARDWVPYRDGIMTRFPAVTDADLTDADGNTATLARRIANYEGSTPAEAQEALLEFLGGPMPADAFADPTHDNAAILESEDYIPAGEDALADDKRFGDDNTSENPVGREV